MTELLAPAGDRECLHAAVCAGADAVYLGLDEFNARRNAGNFSLENLAAACDYAHLRGVLVYVALNVEILPSELGRALTCAREAYAAGADAFIVQDVGLAAELAEALPEAELHASTQMNLHNAAGIELAARLGMRRVTLARELAIPEISALCELAGEFGMEVECFAHGALCICYSGQCLMSSMIGGRSANRGLCAQACRLPYELHRADRAGALPAEGDHLLSPRDLCSIGVLDRLVGAGVASLKVEGRMKSADYVHEVVSVYREALDEALAAGRSGGGPEKLDEVLAAGRPGGGSEAPARRQETLACREARLAEVFSRGFTTAYLEGKRGNEIMSYARPNNRGVFVGRVARVDGDAAEISVETELHAGDVLEFWTNRGHFAASCPIGAAAGEKARVPVEQRVGKGDRVFRVRNAATTFTACDDDPFAPRIPVSGAVTLRIGEPAHVRFAVGRAERNAQGTPDARAEARGMRGEAWGTVVERARTKALSEDDVRAHIDRLGQTPFDLLELDVELDEGVGMGFSQLHHLRSEALEALSAAMLGPWASRRAHAHERAARIPTARARETVSGTPRRARQCSVRAWASNPGCARAARRAGAESVYVPVLNFRRGQAHIAGERSEEAEQAGYPKQCIMTLPVVDHDPVAHTREEALAFDPWDYVREGKTVFADSLADAIRALDMGARVELGPHVPLTNAASLRAVASLGVERVWLSPELTLGQIADLAEGSPVELGLFVSGAQELMICEHCLLMSQGACPENCESCSRRNVGHWLVDRKGFEFPVVTDALGRSHLYNGIELDALSTMPDLVDIGITAVMVDTTLMDRKTAEAAVRRAVRAASVAFEERRALEKRPGTTTGHLFRGVQ